MSNTIFEINFQDYLCRWKYDTREKLTYTASNAPWFEQTNIIRSDASGNVADKKMASHRSHIACYTIVLSSLVIFSPFVAKVENQRVEHEYGK